jgi:hypothetical protein
MKLGYRLIQTPILFQSVTSGNGREVQKKEQMSMLFETGSNPFLLPQNWHKSLDLTSIWMYNCCSERYRKRNEMLVQTQRAIDNLLAAGLKRKEFRAKVETKRCEGGTYYGDVQIVLLCPTERAVEVAPALAKHFEVVEMVVDGKVRHVSVIDGVPGLKIENV